MAQVNTAMVERIAQKVRELLIGRTALTFTEENMYPLPKDPVY